MQLKNSVFLAFVFLLKVIAEAYFPGFEIPAGFINTVLLILFAAVGVDVVEFRAQASRFSGNFK